MGLKLGLCVAAVTFGFGGAAASGAPLPVEHDTALDAAIARVVPAGTESSDVHLLRTQWNGQPVVFVDYPVHQKVQDETETDIVLKAVFPAAGGYKAADIDTFEEEGGTAEIRAIALANADKDKAQELIVLVAWPVQHYDVEGTYYQVKVYDDVGAGVHPLTALSKHFGEGCDCGRRDDKPDRFHYKTIAAIKKELVRMGY